MRKSWLIILFVFVASIISVYASSPARCIATNSFQCTDYYVNPTANQINFSLRNELDEISNLSFTSQIRNEENTSAANCLCNGQASCNAQIHDDINVTCTFPQDIIPIKDRALFHFEGIYVLNANPESVMIIEGAIYTSPYEHPKQPDSAIDVMLRYWETWVILISLLIFYIFVIFFFVRTNKFKPWIKQGVKWFFITALVLLVLIALLYLVYAFFDIVFLLFSLIPSILIGIIFGIVSYFKNKKSEKNKK
jgi:hypothetical protein